MSNNNILDYDVIFLVIRQRDIIGPRNITYSIVFNDEYVYLNHKYQYSFDSRLSKVLFVKQLQSCILYDVIVCEIFNIPFIKKS